MPYAAKLLLHPDAGWPEISGALGALGFERDPDTAATPPAIAGEPEFASWFRAEPDGLATYSFNPVVRLRVLEIEGDDARAVADALRHRLRPLSERDLAVLLASADPAEQLLGLYAAAEGTALGLLPAVEALRVGPNERVSRAAARTAERLSLALLELGAERLAREQARHPERSAVFPRLGDANTRREVLLWLLHDAPEAPGDTVKALRSGLVDPDWQVRFTAMLVAARLRLAELWLDVKRAAPPPSGRLERRFRSAFVGLRKAILAELAGEPRPAAADDRSRAALRLRRLVAGEGTGERDELSAWLDDLLRLPPAG